MIEKKILIGKQIEPYIQNLAQLRCEIFCEYPYLYVGDMEYEKWYLENYAKQENSFLVLLLKNNEVIGCSSGMPMEDEKHEQFKKTLTDRGYDIRSVFTYGESLLKKEYRGKGYGNVFFEEREKFVRSFGNKFKTIAFFAVERDPHDARRPKDYQDLFEFWKKKGFVKSDIYVYFPWQEIGEEKETDKLMYFWLKNI